MIISSRGVLSLPRWLLKSSGLTLWKVGEGEGAPAVARQRRRHRRRRGLAPAPARAPAAPAHRRGRPPLRLQLGRQEAPLRELLQLETAPGEVAHVVAVESGLHACTRLAGSAGARIKRERGVGAGP
jgi:hypothetical protein